MKKQLYTSILMPNMERELKTHPEYLQPFTNLHPQAYIILKVFSKGKLADTWYILVQSQTNNRNVSSSPKGMVTGGSGLGTPNGSQLGTLPQHLSGKSQILFTKDRPEKSKTDGFKKVILEIEDRDLLNMITGMYLLIMKGGLSGLKAYTSKKLKVKGDIEVARSIEKLFVKAGGVKKTMDYIEKQKSKL